MPRTSSTAAALALALAALVVAETVVAAHLRTDRSPRYPQRARHADFSLRPSYSYLDLVYLDSTISDDVDEIQGNGPAFALSYMPVAPLFVTASYAQVEFEDVLDVDQTAVGVGAAIDVGDRGSLFLAYRRIEFDAAIGPFSASDSGNALSVGFRQGFANFMEFGLALASVEVDGESTQSWGLEGLYHLGRHAALVLGYAQDLEDDFDEQDIGLGFRILFR